MFSSFYSLGIYASLCFSKDSKVSGLGFMLYVFISVIQLPFLYVAFYF